MQTKHKTLLIIWHSRTGASEQAAKAAAAAAEALIDELASMDDTPYQLLVKKAAEVSLAELLSAHAYLFCAPENLASLSGQMKEFFDHYYYPLLGQIEGRYYSAIIAAGTDGTAALKQLQRICRGWRLNEAVPAIILNTAAASQAQILAPKQLGVAQVAQAEEIGATLMALIST
ncbi:hypothetical protein RP300_01592 [Oligella urethralis]|uniref:NAD(P)H-dependent oxidoreductase n=1 Tax=Oligella TaxID=90243 RepID=UPI0008A64763|nr:MULTISPECIES: NAD(P)H-dependent oxidoreductase [Oligella]OFS82750.1 flavodoxin [Oligella sp. HMSC05A10]WOS38028.1 hypothetical protein RP300_01592 [Oligella urethralis]